MPALVGEGARPPGGPSSGCAASPDHPAYYPRRPAPRRDRTNCGRTWLLVIRWCMSCTWLVLNSSRVTAARSRAARAPTTARPRRWVRMVVVMVVILWLLIRCGPADETHRAARATHGQSPRRQDTCHPGDRPTGPGISRPRASPRPRSLTAYHHARTKTQELSSLASSARSCTARAETDVI